MHRSISVTKKITIAEATSVLESHGYTVNPPAHNLEIPIILSEDVGEGEIFLFLEGRVVGQIRTKEDVCGGSFPVS